VISIVNSDLSLLKKEKEISFHRKAVVPQNDPLGFDQELSSSIRDLRRAIDGPLYDHWIRANESGNMKRRKRRTEVKMDGGEA
jgi:hypothetical protein